MREHKHMSAAAMSAIAYMADHDYGLAEDTGASVDATQVGDAGSVGVQIDDGGTVSLFVLDRRGVQLWGAEFDQNTPRALVLDAIELAEMSAKVSYPARRAAQQPAHQAHSPKPCRPWSLGCVGGQTWHGEPVNIHPEGITER